MNGDRLFRHDSLLPHFALLALAGALTGIVSQLSSWQALTGVDPGYLPFLLPVVAGILIGAIAPVGVAALGGFITGIAVAGGGLAYHALAHPAVRDGWPTVASYLIIMACLGAFGGFLGAIPVRLLRLWLKRDAGRGRSAT